MRYKIFSLNQEALINLDLGVEEALVLDHFLKFKDSNKMKRVFDEELQDQGYWLSYDAIIKELPILFKATPKDATEEEAAKILKNNKAKVARILKNLSCVITMKRKVKKMKDALGSEMYAFINRDNLTKLLIAETVEVEEEKAEGIEETKEAVETEDNDLNVLHNLTSEAYKHLRVCAIENLRSRNVPLFSSNSEEQELIDSTIKREMVKLYYLMNRRA